MDPATAPALVAAARKGGAKRILSAYLLTLVAAQLLDGYLGGSGGPPLAQLSAAPGLALLALQGRRWLPVTLLAPLPLGLLLSPAGQAWPLRLILLLLAGLGQAAAALAFRRAHLSPRLRRAKDVGGFLGLGLLGPMLAMGGLRLMGLPGGPLHGRLDGSDLVLQVLGQTLGILVAGPLLLYWGKPVANRRAREAVPSARSGSADMALGLTLVAAVLGVVVLGDPVTLNLKYLLFLPLAWIVVGRGLRGAILALPVLTLLLAATLRWTGLPLRDMVGLQAFLLVLAAMTLFLGSAVQALNMALDLRHRRSRHLTRLLESTGAIPWEVEVGTGRCPYLGMAVERLVPWTQEQWLAEPFWGGVLLPEDQPAFRAFLQDCREPRGDHQVELRLRTPEGATHWIRVAGSLEPGTAPGLVVGFLFDIQGQKRAEAEALHASLREKDLLLREIHHRVKNNLQVVSSLLRLQSAAHTEAAVQEALKEAQDRIQAIALIHQKLKHAPDYSQLDLPDYVRTLCERLVRSYASVPALIDLQVRVGNVDIGPEAPVPIGLILNELVANALQHAFPPGEGGQLEVELLQDAGGWVTLRVADSGTGLPEAVDLECGGLGFQLVRALADQLKGSLEVERRRGASFLLHFQPQPHRP